MVIWIFVFIILMGVFFAISLYMYDNSQFRKITGYSFFALITDKKVRSTYKLVQSLHKAKGEHKILLNVTLPTTNQLIDAILIHQSGAYIINVQHFNGWIYGREQDIQWAEALYKEKLNKFDNPLVENKLAIIELEEILSQSSRNFYSMVAFSNNCSFRKIIIHSNNTDVLKVKELSTYWKHSTDIVLSTEEISNIYNQLERYMEFKSVEDKAQKRNIVPN